MIDIRNIGMIPMLVLSIFVFIGTACSNKDTSLQTSNKDKQKKHINLETLLKNMRNVTHLPELLDAKTAMSSTWDRTGGNDDGDDFRKIDGRRNILLDMEGPGVVHRIFTGRLFLRGNKNLN